MAGQAIGGQAAVTGAGIPAQATLVTSLHLQSIYHSVLFPSICPDVPYVQLDVDSRLSGFINVGDEDAELTKP
jgi:hypothetical protein